MKILRAFLLMLAGLLLPAVASAECAGRDLLDGLKARDPDAYADLFERGAEMRHGRGKLWQVRRGDAPPSVILGTYHDTGIAEEPLSAAAVHALDTARAVVVEITPEEQAKLRHRIATDPGFAFDPEGGAWVEQLSPEQRRMAEGALARRGLTLEGVRHMRPWMLMSVLGVPQCQLAEMATGKPVLDALLVQRALDQGTPVIGLETYDAAIGAFDLIDTREVQDLAVDMLAQIDEEEDIRATMAELYRDGEIGAILEFGIWASARENDEEKARKIAQIFRDAIITHRNREWMEPLIEELDRGNAFVAFGSLHLIGEEGVLALLEEEGFEVLRLDG